MRGGGGGGGILGRGSPRGERRLSIHMSLSTDPFLVKNLLSKPVIKIVVHEAVLKTNKPKHNVLLIKKTPLTL